MSIADLAKNLHNAGKAAGIKSLRVCRLDERGVTKSGSTRYEGTVRGMSDPVGDALHGIHGGTPELFFWCISKEAPQVLQDALQQELERLNKESGKTSHD